jgi:hypothetical protein
MAVVADTEKVTAWLPPAWTAKEEPGDGFTLEGSPCSMISTEPLNPLCGATETVTADVVFPITAEAETGEADKLKSGIAGGGSCWLLPPHAISATERASVASNSEIALEMNRVLISGPVRTTGRSKDLYIPRGLVLSTEIVNAIGPLHLKVLSLLGRRRTALFTALCDI